MYEYDTCSVHAPHLCLTGAFVHPLACGPCPHRSPPHLALQGASPTSCVACATGTTTPGEGAGSSAECTLSTGACSCSRTPTSPPDLPRRCTAAQIPCCMPGFRLSPVISTALVLSLSPPKCHRPDTAYVDASWHYLFTGCMGFIPPHHTNAYTHTCTHNAYARMHTHQITHNLWTGSFATSQVLVPKWV